MARDEKIYVFNGSKVEVEFANWLNNKGYLAELTEDECLETSSEQVGELWADYCKG